MCIIIDTNVFSKVFKKSNSDHLNFEPVFNWIFEGKGIVVFGGTKYLKEITGFLKLLNNLKKIGKAKSIVNLEVDELEKRIISELPDDCDDHHLIALLILTKCKLIASEDARAFPYFGHANYFTKKTRPRIYTSPKNGNLLCDNNISDFCKPVAKITNQQKAALGDISS